MSEALESATTEPFGIAPSGNIEPAALFFDVDGTIVSHNVEGTDAEGFLGNRPTPAVYDAFERLRANGHQAFICTGRPLCLIPDNLLELSTVGLVLGAGAVVVMNGKVEYGTVIPDELLRKTAEIMSQTGTIAMFEGTEACVVIAPENESYLGFEGIPHVRNYEELRKVAPHVQFNKMSFDERTFDRLEGSKDFLFEHYTLCDLGLGLFEASLRGVNKGTGVQRALELLDTKLGMRPARTFAFGDSENDLAMMRVVDMPVAMGNALDSVKEIASYVTESVDDDGVPKALEHFGLI